MNIDKEKLVELLVDKTGMQAEEVESQLDQLIERIVDAAKRGKALEIKDFGLFYFDESGELKFDAAEELSTEISFKYAGMKPVELKPERDSAMPPIDIKEEITDVGTDDTDGLVALTGTDSGIAATEDDDPFGIEEEDSMDDFDFLSDLDESTDTDADEMLSSDTETEEIKQPATKPEKDKKPKPPARKIPVHQRKKNNSAVIAIAAILLLILLIGGTIWFMDTMSDSSEPAQTAGTNLPGPVPEELPVITDEDAENFDQLTARENETGQPEEGEEQEPPTEVETVAPTADPADQPVYGLMGAVLEEANNGYSIVLHSFNTEESARAAAAMLSRDGYRVLVNSRTIAGGAMWRVSVGQFETLSDAQSAAEQLPSPYNTQNFIHRIQIN